MSRFPNGSFNVVINTNEPIVWGIRMRLSKKKRLR